MKGMIAAGHELTARAGVEMLENGGNAFDAAVAAVFASFVCESVLTSAGGGGFFMAQTKGGSPVLYDFFSKVPGKGSFLRTEGIDFFPVYINFADTTQELHIGRGSVAVPGCIAGLKTVHERHCTLPLSVILSPAIRYAREGVRLNAHQAYFISILSPVLTVSEEGRKVYAPRGALLREGDIIFNKDIGETLEYLSKEGLDKFYEGAMAEKILEGFGETGLITKKDLEGFSVSVREPLQVSLKLLESRNLSGLGHNTTAYLRLILEAMRVTDEARREDFDHRVYEQSMAEEFLSEQNVALYSKRMARGLASSPYEEHGLGNTTQISVVDSEGNAA
jgi:gamma-glutamyltranspeptidase/glutathione hydrolase